MNCEKAQQYLDSTGFWFRIECEDCTDEATFFSAFDEDGEEVSLKVEIENNEMLVFEYYQGGIWTLVDLP